LLDRLPIQLDGVFQYLQFPLAVEHRVVSPVRGDGDEQFLGRDVPLDARQGGVGGLFAEAPLVADFDIHRDLVGLRNPVRDILTRHPEELELGDGVVRVRPRHDDAPLGEAALLAEGLKRRVVLQGKAERAVGGERLRIHGRGGRRPRGARGWDGSGDADHTVSRGFPGRPVGNRWPLLRERRGRHGERPLVRTARPGPDRRDQPKRDGPAG